MFCPVCNATDTKVVDSRLSPDGTSIRRRRECSACEYRFSTIEEIELLDIVVVKRDGRREAFSRDKIAGGLRRSLEKRSYTEAEFRTLLHAIERGVQRLKSSEVKSEEVGEVVMQELKGFDKVAYIRFASVYRAFEDVKTFQEELKDLMQVKGRRVSGKTN